MNFNGFEYDIVECEDKKTNITTLKAYILTKINVEHFNKNRFITQRNLILKENLKNCEITYCDFIDSEMDFIKKLNINTSKGNFIYCFELGKNDVLSKKTILGVIKLLINNIETKQISEYDNLEKIKMIEDEKNIDRKITLICKQLSMTKKALVEHLGYTEDFLYQSRQKKSHSEKFVIALNMFIKIKKLECEIRLFYL